MTSEAPPPTRNQHRGGPETLPARWAMTAVLVAMVAAPTMGVQELHTLPAAAERSLELRQRLEEALGARSADDRPRTEHLRSDGSPRFVNRLILEDSPYLRQHAHNPVDWYPWGEEAFERARREEKPILLSIGYSTCHWCHVMERESFDDLEIARLLNESFVSIKVDREQRPDVDELYMTAVQLTGKRGGWPLTSFLTPAGRPFYGATYIPPNDFAALLVRVAEAFRDRREEIEGAAAQLQLLVSGALAAGGEAGEVDLDRAFEDAASSLLERFDPVHGGFGSAPKFPQEPQLLLLLRSYARSLIAETASAAEGGPGSAGVTAESMGRALRKTLVAMASGGIYDQVGGGFHRYSTDQRFLVPHFEKMLYNQAQLATVYAQAHRLFGDPLFERVARQTLDYLLREMRSPAGLFYSATDADSRNEAGEEEEGAFFLWTRDQLAAALSPEDAALAIDLFSVEQKGNFEGRSILFLDQPLEETARELGLPAGELIARVDRIREVLRERRSLRPAPLRDDKALTSWNALAIEALAEAGEILDEPRYRKAAVESAGELWRRVHRGDGRLWRVDVDGRTTVPGLQEDSAFLARAFVALYDLTGDADWLERSALVLEAMEEDFGDRERGGWFTSSANATLLIARPKAGADGAIPSGASLAVRAWSGLHRRTGDLDARRRAERGAARLASSIARSPSSFAVLLLGLDELGRGEMGPLDYAGQGAARLHATLDDLDAGQGSDSASGPARRSVDFCVELRIRDGWHLNAHRPLSDDLVATELVLRPGSSYRLAEMAYPEPVRRVLGPRAGSAAQGEVAILEGKAVLHGRLERKALSSPSNWPEPVVFRITLQVCSDDACQLPEEIDLELFVPPATGAK